ncbi:MAG: PKD domain-containing protein [Chitinophagaceae bacterium]
MKKIRILFVLTFLSVLSFAQTTPDPGLPGTYAVSRDTFDLGDLAFKPDSFATNVEMRGVVYYPTGLAGGPYPVLFLMHGRHVTTYNVSNPSSTNLTWPPASGFQSITSFEGYNYFAQLMASHGFIVVSVSVNAINARDNARSDLGMNARAQALQHYMDLWNGYNTSGGAPFGTRFVGKLDMQRMGTMGHSRGGEGVVYHALLNQSLGSPYGLKAVITLAPIDNGRKVLNNIPLMNIAPYCDGDVTTLSGVHFYDDARYNVAADTAPKHSVLLMGANHNFFNTVWTPGSYIAGTSDDGDDLFGTTRDAYCSSKRTGTGRLDTATQKAAFCTYAAAFFRRYVAGDTSFAPILEVSDRVPPVSSKMPSGKVFVSWHPGADKRLDINRIQSASEEVTNTLGGAVSKSALTAYAICGGGGTMTSCGIASSANQEPHKGSSTAPGMAQLNMRWVSKTDYCTNELPPAYKDVSGYAALSFRAAVNFRYAAATTDFTVALTDSFGHTARVTASRMSGALFYPPGLTSGAVPKILFNTIKIPLDSFTGVNLTKITGIHFLFDTLSAGAILIGDLALVAFEDRCSNIAASFADTVGSGYTVRFGDESVTNSGDTLFYHWNFGDPASGLADTASSDHPVHVFSGAGTYKVCLAVEVRRPSGNICRDTFCRNVLLVPNGLREQQLSTLNVYPNPARDRLVLSGINNGDVWEMKTIQGQLIVRAIADKPEVYLPAFLSNGLYLVTIHTQAGSKTFKVQLQR